MSPLTLLDHLLNFVAPAFFVALALALLTRWSFQRDAAAPRFWAQAALNFVAGVGVLAAGLWHFGRDGKMATYLAMVVACGTVQWLSARAYRR